MWKRLQAPGWDRAGRWKLFPKLPANFTAAHLLGGLPSSPATRHRDLSLGRMRGTGTGTARSCLPQAFPQHFLGHEAPG